MLSLHMVALSACQGSYCLKAVGVGNTVPEFETVCGGACVCVCGGVGGGSFLSRQA